MPVGDRISVLALNANAKIYTTTCSSQELIDSCYTSSPNSCCSEGEAIAPEIEVTNISFLSDTDDGLDPAVLQPSPYDETNPALYVAIVTATDCPSNEQYQLKGAANAGIDYGDQIYYDFKITAGTTGEDSSYEIYENITHRWTFDTQDFCADLAGVPCIIQGQTQCNNDTLDVPVYLMSYGCADDTADNGSSSNVGCPDSSGVPDPNITDCCTYPPSYDVIISEVFLKGDEGPTNIAVEDRAKIPQWIELTNVTNTDIDISGYWIESIDDEGNRISLSPLSGIEGYTQNNNNGFIHNSIMKAKDNSPIQNFYCPSNSPHEYYNAMVCDFSCDYSDIPDTYCPVITHGDKYVVISNHEENNYGVFNSWGVGAPNLSFGDLLSELDGDLNTILNDYYDTIDYDSIINIDIPLNISFTDFKLDKEIQVTDNECTSTPWIDYRNQHAGEVHGSGKIILWKSNPDDSYFPQMESIFCYDRTISGTYPKGYPLEYNSHNPGAIPLIEHISDLNNWDLDEDNSTSLFRAKDTSIDKIFKFLNWYGVSIDFDEPNIGNKWTTQLPDTFDFVDNYGTPLTINQIYSTSLLSGWCDDFTQEDLDILEADCPGTWYKVCTDPDALNYICRRDEFVFNPDICPSGASTQPEQLPLWILDTEENNNNSCYYSIS